MATVDYKTTVGQCSCIGLVSGGYPGANTCGAYYKVTGNTAPYTLQLYTDSACGTAAGSALTISAADTCTASSTLGYKISTSDTTAILNMDCTTAGTCSCLDAAGNACPTASNGQDSHSSSRHWS